MSSIGDSTQISDLSGISRISRSSSIRPSAFNISECQASSTIRDPISCKSSSSVPAGPSKLSRVIKLIATFEDSMLNYAKLKLLHDCIIEISENGDSTIGNDVSKSLKTILATHEAKKYLQLPNPEKNNTGDLTLLGIIDLPKVQLSHNEKRDISGLVEKKILERTNSFLHSYKISGGKIGETIKSHESAAKTSLLESHETDLIRWNDPMNEVCTEYNRDLLTCSDLLRQWQRLKYIEMKELNIRNVENLLLQAQVSEVQANISRKICALRMFNETPKTVDAFGILSENLDARILDIREKKKKKEILKMTYSDVSSTEYDKLLTKYTELCSVIKKKEHLMEML